MKNIILGGIIGGVILFIWGIIAWFILPLHEPSIRAITNEDIVIEALRTSIDAKGVYVFPGMPPSAEGMPEREQQAAMDVWTEKYRRGPTGVVIYDPQGSEPMMVGQMISGFVIGVISAMIAAWFLSRSTAAMASYFSRVIYFGMLGIFVSFVTHIVNWNWMNYPLDFTTAMVADTIIGWLLTGLGIAAIVKMRPSEAGTQV